MTVPVTDLMHGAQWAKYYVNKYLTADLPNRINRYRSGWNLDSNELPTPEFFLTYEPIALDHWPTIITVCLSSSPFERLMQGSQGDPLYRVTYSMRTYIWTKTEGSEAVTLMRDRLTTVVRSALMDKPCLTLTTSPAQKQTERCHPLFTRPLNIMEYRRIQSFPDDYIIKGSVLQKYRQIGNAVPVKLAEHMADTIKKILL